MIIFIFSLSSILRFHPYTYAFHPTKKSKRSEQCTGDARTHAVALLSRARTHEESVINSDELCTKNNSPYSVDGCARGMQFRDIEKRRDINMWVNASIHNRFSRMNKRIDTKTAIVLMNWNRNANECAHLWTLRKTNWTEIIPCHFPTQSNRVFVLPLAVRRETCIFFTLRSANEQENQLRWKATSCHRRKSDKGKVQSTSSVAWPQRMAKMGMSKSRFRARGAVQRK